MKSIPPKEHVIVLGDFNARVAADHDAWPSCFGHIEIGKINESGHRLLLFCSFNGLCVTNSFFQTKPRHRVLRCHPCSKHWYQLDMILTRHNKIRLVQTNRTYHSADCDTDHSLVCCKTKLQPKKIHNTKWKGKPRINIMGMQLPDKAEEFILQFSSETSLRNISTALPSEKTLQSLRSSRSKVQQTARQCANE